VPSAVPAHLTGDELPLPTWLVAYGTAFAVVLVFLVLRSTWARPRLTKAATGAELPRFVQSAGRPIGVVLRVIGVAAFALVLAAALFGVDDDVSNLAPYAHITFVLGVIAVSALIGDLWRALDPFPPLATVVYGRSMAGRTDRLAPGLWPAVVVVGSYLWFQTAYHSPTAPRAAAVWLVGVTVLALVGAGLWGRRWLLDDEGLAGFFGLIASMAPLHQRPDTRRLAARWPFTGLAAVPPRPGAEALLLVAIGAFAFDGINNTAWWLADVVGTRTGWSRTVVSTAGLVFFIGIASLVWYGAARWSARQNGTDVADVSQRYYPVLVPVVVGYAVAHYVGVFFVQLWNVFALLSDPFGRGWDALGTIDWTFDYTWLSVRTVAWIGVIAIAVTHLGAVLVVHDRSLEGQRSLRAAAGAATPFIAMLALSAAMGILYVSGG
jgi:hypothetical protein